MVDNLPFAHHWPKLISELSAQYLFKWQVPFFKDHLPVRAKYGAESAFLSPDTDCAIETSNDVDYT